MPASTFSTAAPMLPVSPWPATFEQGWQELPTQGAYLQWSLQLEGMVSQPCQLSYQQLLQLPQSYQPRRIASQHGWSYKAAWHGVLLKHLLPLATVQGGCQFVQQRNAAGETLILPLAPLLEQDALILTHWESDALPPSHGGPLRLVSFQHAWEASLPQLTQLTFLAKASKEEQAAADALLIQPSKVYAYDLKTLKSIERAGEVKTF